MLIFKMKVMNYHKIISKVLSLFLVTSFVGCSDWLDVKEKTMVEEKDQFSTYAGFQDALADCYANLASSTLYGGALTMNMTDLLANIYDQPNQQRSGLSYYMYTHDYSQQDLKDACDQIYKLLYQTVSQSNVILKHTDDTPSVLTEGERQLLAGEAHAIKALCHFEILRLFGPIPSEGSSSDIRLDYNDVSDITTLPEACDYTTFVNRVREEFAQARALLAGTDPILTYNFDELNKVGTSGFEYVNLKDEKYTVFRQFRLNYWAVRALQARMELYVGNKAEANKIAHEILAAKTAAGKPLVKLSTLEDIAAGYNSSPSEGLWLVSVPELLKNAANFGFQSSTVDADAVYTVPEETLKERIFENKNIETDKRWKVMWKMASRTGGGGSVPILMKYYYEDKKESEVTLEMQTKQQVVPVIRLSELYLMLMETSDNLAEINRLYKDFMLARGVNLQTDAFSSLAAVADAMPLEYLREYYGEGIMFFFYKRRGMVEDFPYGMKDFRKESYVLPFSDAQKKAEEEKKAEDTKKDK